MEYSYSNDLLDFLNQLQGLPSVKIVEMAPLPAPPPFIGATPDYSSSQGYLDSAPGGIDAIYSWGVPGGTGQNVKIYDVERGWNQTHEDLAVASGVTLLVDSGDSAVIITDNDHGTAVLGEMVGTDNGFGVIGISFDALIGLAPTSTDDLGFNPGNAIALAAVDADPGDVILLEIQTLVCGLAGCTTGDQSNCGPSEWSTSVFDATQLAVSLGVTVVAAAGNGSVDLDQAACGTTFNRSVRDSGAIIVGAGENPASGVDRERKDFSSYGSRVDVQGWGSGVMTTGYGSGDRVDEEAPDNNDRWYTAGFSGTSSASPIVTGAVANLQGIAQANGGGQPLAPTDVRAILVATGSPQQGDTSEHIGPRPNLHKAIAEIIPVMQVTPGSLSFDATCVGNTLRETLKVCNTGKVDLRVDSFSSDDDQFSVTDPSGGYPVYISHDFCFPFEVAFTASSTGAQSATLSIETNDPVADQPLDVSINATVGTPDINLVIANSGDFGNVCKGGHEDLDLTLFNQGMCDLTISNIELVPPGGSFVLPSDLDLPLVLSHDADFTLPVRYAPGICDDTPENAQIKITSDDPYESMQSIGISGASPCPNLVIDPAGLEDLYAFPATVSDSTGSLGCYTEKTVNLRNNGGCPLTIESISAVGNVDPLDYSVTAPTVFPVILPVGEETLGVNVRFTPQADVNPLAPSEVFGQLIVASDDPDGNGLGDLCGESTAQSGMRILVTDVSTGAPINVGEVDAINISSKGKKTPSPINLAFTDQPVSSTIICGNNIDYHVDQETLSSVATSGSNPKSSWQAKAREGNIQTTQSFSLGQCEFREFQLQLQDSDATACLLLPKGDSCSTDGECCSGKCKGPAGGKSCK